MHSNLFEPEVAQQKKSAWHSGALLSVLLAPELERFVRSSPPPPQGLQSVLRPAHVGVRTTGFFPGLHLRPSLEACPRLHPEPKLNLASHLLFFFLQVKGSCEAPRPIGPPIVSWGYSLSSSGHEGSVIDPLASWPPQISWGFQGVVKRLLVAFKPESDFCMSPGSKLSTTSGHPLSSAGFDFNPGVLE